MSLVSLPVVIVHTSSFSSFGAVQLVGVLVWSIGFYFETVGDWQMMKFKGDPKNKGKLMTTGLWSLTRHPNYFGEVTMWWGLFLVVVALPLWYISIISPLLITYLILGVSGIPMLEKKYEGRKDFEEYKRRTAAFFPLPTKK